MEQMAGSSLTLLRRVAVDTGPLRHHDFRRLFVGQGVSFLGFQVTAVAVPVQLFAITNSSLWVGLNGLAGLIPLIAFGLYGGAVADAMDRRRLLLWSSCLVWAVTGGLLAQALLHVDNAPLILGLVAVQAIGFAMSSAARNAIVPRILPVAEVPAGNTLNFTMSNVATVAGPLLAGVVLASGSYSTAYAIDAALFTVGFYAAVRLPPVPPTTMIGKPGFRSVVEGLRYIVNRPVLLMSFVIDLCAMIFAMPRALFPQVAEQRFGGEGAVGWLTAAIAAGAVIAGLASGWIGRVHRQGVALVCAVIAWGIAVAASGLAHALWLALLFLAIAGAADLVSAVYRQTILQVYAPDEMRGRLQGVFTVVVAGGPRLGDLRAGAMAAATSVTWAWVGGGIACVIAVVLLAIAVPQLLQYRTDQVTPAHAGAVELIGEPEVSELGIADTSTPSEQPSPQS
jgi:MFS family permease